jgi:hypothetical protein
MPTDHEALRKKYPGTHLYRGPFPKGYFKRKKDRKEDSPEGLKLRKSLVRRGLPASWAKNLLKPDLKPYKLVQRLRSLEELQTEIQTINRTTRERIRAIRHRIQRLLTDNDFQSITNPGESNTPTDPAEYHAGEAKPDLPGLWQNERRQVPGQSEQTAMPSLLVSSHSSRSAQVLGESATPEDPPDSGIFH